MKKSKTITSTNAQNNFGQILNEVIQNNTRYIVMRRNSPQVIILSLSDFEQILADVPEQEQMVKMVRELTPVYALGSTIE